jgi:hypothetical protein
LQAIFWGGRNFFSKWIGFKGGIELGFLRANSFGRNSKRFHKFSVIKKFTAGKPSD